MTPSRNTALALALLLAGALAAPPADAGGRHGHHRGHGHHGHHHSRISLSFAIGAPLAAGVFWNFAHPHVQYHPVYTAPRVIVVPAVPVTYIEQGVAPAPIADAQAWWYWCAGANAYHPYVSECPGGWQRVAPQAPPR